MIQVSVPKCFSISAQAYADNQAWSIWWYQKDRSVWVMGTNWISFLSFAVLISRKAPDSGYTLLHNNPTKVLGKPLYRSIWVLSFSHISGNTMKSYLWCWLALKTYVANFFKSLVSTFKLQQAYVCNITSFLTFLKSWTNQVQSLFLRSISREKKWDDWSEKRRKWKQNHPYVITVWRVLEKSKRRKWKQNHPYAITLWRPPAKPKLLKHEWVQS
jgi:hypothetical protein